MLRENHGPTINVHLQGEGKTAAKPITTEHICSYGCANLILERLDRAYAIHNPNQPDNYLVGFLDYTWNKELSGGHFISGFHTRVEKISDVNVDDKLKGHLLLRQADVVQQEQNTVIGASSSIYGINRISSYFPNVYRNDAPTEATQFNNHNNGMH